MLAPIVLFVYNRPYHTKCTIESLLLNDLAKNSDLYIFIDNLKFNCNKNDIIKHNQVKEYVKSINGFNKLTIHERPYNYGLSKNITLGVTEILEKHEKIIVLEDDMISSSGFLKYMNDALNIYQNNPKVGCIHAWNYPINTSKYNKETFFLKGADCWGWATWKNSWILYESDGIKLLNYILNNNLIYEFNRRNTIDFIKMLKDQINNKNDSWAIRWHASLFINNKYCLHPVKPLIKNIGFDSSGTHNSTFLIKQEIIDNINISLIDVEDSEWFYSEFVGKTHDSFFKSQSKNIFKRVFNLLKRKIFI